MADTKSLSAYTDATKAPAVGPSVQGPARPERTTDPSFHVAFLCPGHDHQQ